VRTRRLVVLLAATLVASALAAVPTAHAAEVGLVVVTSAVGNENFGTPCSAVDCTLGQAVFDANADPGNHYTITFAIDAVVLRDDMPSITVPMSIDGLAGRLSPVKVTSDAPLPNGRVALNVIANDVTVRGLDISGFNEGVTVKVVSPPPPPPSVDVRITRVAAHDNGSHNIHLDCVGTCSQAEYGNFHILPPALDAPTPTQVGFTAPTSDSSITAPFSIEVYTCDSGTYDEFGVDTAGDPTEGTAFVAEATGIGSGGTGSVTFPAVGGGTRFSATATDAHGNTSQYSACGVPVVGPALPGTSETATCTPGSACTTDPLAGPDTVFTLTGQGGDSPATLTAELDGGIKPECALEGLSAEDWVRFGFVHPPDGRTWRKLVTLTGTHPAAQSQAHEDLFDTQICYAAPYRFETRPGFPLTGGERGTFFQGILPECAELTRGTGRPIHQLRPCITARHLVAVAGGFVPRITFLVPAGEDDPLAKSARKRKKHRTR
jgi:hypothetical protein